ncbi:hypothetical protein GCM10009839_91040 [Catenulispora yoronensis]|uniref:GATA-type domain-containing protein n=1 Tax=Catenulispora yoronensis TaxID=450799 RepID=A0ABP5HBU7_9ACTN
MQVGKQADDQAAQQASQGQTGRQAGEPTDRQAREKKTDKRQGKQISSGQPSKQESSHPKLENRQPNTEADNLCPRDCQSPAWVFGSFPSVTSAGLCLQCRRPGVQSMHTQQQGKASNATAWT